MKGSRGFFFFSGVGHGVKKMSCDWGEENGGGEEGLGPN